MRACERVPVGASGRGPVHGHVRERRVRRGRPRRGPRRAPHVLHGDGGFVTAETAVVLPVLVAFAMALVWGLLVMSAQIRCVDAARAGARAAARQDPADAVLAVARATAPRGADVTVSREGDQVRVVVVAKPPALRGLPFEVREEAVAAAEEAPAAAGDDLGAVRGAVQGPVQGAGAGADARRISGEDAGAGPGSGAGAGSGAESESDPGSASGTASGTASEVSLGRQSASKAGSAPGAASDSGAGP